MAHNRNDVVISKRTDKTRSGEEFINLERGTTVLGGRIAQREDLDIAWTCAKAV